MSKATILDSATYTHHALPQALCDENAVGPTYARAASGTALDGLYYMHDRRLNLVENTLEHPAIPPPDNMLCPIVPKTFLNEEHCMYVLGIGVRVTNTARCMSVRFNFR